SVAVQRVSGNQSSSGCLIVGLQESTAPDTQVKKRVAGLELCISGNTVVAALEDQGAYKTISTQLDTPLDPTAVNTLTITVKAKAVWLEVNGVEVGHGITKHTVSGTM